MKLTETMTPIQMRVNVFNKSLQSVTNRLRLAAGTDHFELGHADSFAARIPAKRPICQHFVAVVSPCIESAEHREILQTERHGSERFCSCGLQLIGCGLFCDSNSRRVGGLAERPVFAVGSHATEARKDGVV